MYTITLPGKPHLYNSDPLPAGWETVGEILVNDEATPSALVRNAHIGMYAHARGGSVYILDQREVAFALAATAGVDLDGDQEISAAQAAELVGQTVQAIKYWRSRGYIVPVPGSRPARYKKADIIAASNREIKAGRPKKQS